jgi:hypothetical protein
VWPSDGPATALVLMCLRIFTSPAPLLREHGRGRPRAARGRPLPNSSREGRLRRRWKPPERPGAQALWPSRFCSGLSNGDGEQSIEAAADLISPPQDMRRWAMQFMASAVW